MLSSKRFIPFYPDFYITKKKNNKPNDKYVEVSLKIFRIILNKTDVNLCRKKLKVNITIKSIDTH